MGLKSWLEKNPNQVLPLFFEYFSEISFGRLILQKFPTNLIYFFILLCKFWIFKNIIMFGVLRKLNFIRENFHTILLFNIDCVIYLFLDFLALKMKLILHYEIIKLYYIYSGFVELFVWFLIFMNFELSSTESIILLFLDLLSLFIYYLATINPASKMISCFLLIVSWNTGRVAHFFVFSFMKTTNNERKLVCIKIIHNWAYCVKKSYCKILLLSLIDL